MKANTGEQLKIISTNEDFEEVGRLTVNVQILGTSNSFEIDIRDLYTKEYLEKFSKEDGAHIAFLYSAIIHKNYDIIKYFPKKNSTIGKGYVFISALYVTFLLVANIASSKISQLSFFHFPAVLYLFPLTYIFDDILTEVYGYKASRFIIWIGFFCNLVAVLCLLLIVNVPASNLWSNQICYQSVFSTSLRIFVASSLAYLIGEFLNSYILARLKVLMYGKKLWLRVVSSSSVGLLVDSVIFCFVAFYGIVPTNEIIKMMLVQYLFKISYEVLAIPVTYKIVKYLKEKDKQDYYDFKTNFNPFSLSVD